MPQTLNEIRNILAAAGLSPSKRLGQNFMIDGNIMTKVVAAAGVTPDCAVLEVGCGTGSLTEMLLERAGWVIGVEIDRGLAACLARRLSDRPHWTLIHGDVLASKSRIAPQVVTALRVQADAGRRLRLVANLPYQVASPLMMDLLCCGVDFEAFCVVIQREVAERITASPGTRDFGPMSVVLQACADIERIARIPAQAFWPAPRVASQAIRLDIHRRPFSGPDAIAAFKGLVRAAFAHRRKTLHYNLREIGVDGADLVLASLELGPKVRAEALSVDTWLKLHERLLNSDRMKP